MKADLEYVSRAQTFMQMKIRLEECKSELREAYKQPEKLTGKALLIPKNKATKGELQYASGWRQATFRAIKEILGKEAQ